MVAVERKEGQVVEALRSLQFKVEVGGKIVQCYLAGRMHHNFIRVIPGDRVEVILSPDGERGRIVRRK